MVVKYLGEYVEPEVFDVYSERLKEARVLFGEPIFNESEKLIQSIVKLISQKSGEPFELLLYLTRDEFRNFYEINELPVSSDLKNRYNKSLILGIMEGYTYITGENAAVI